jgi:hypothetical protein
MYTSCIFYVYERVLGSTEYVSLAEALQQHRSAYVSIRPHTLAYVVYEKVLGSTEYVSLAEALQQHTSAYVSIRQHTLRYRESTWLDRINRIHVHVFRLDETLCNHYP